MALEQLPEDIYQLLCTLVPIRDIASLSKTSKSFYRRCRKIRLISWTHSASKTKSGGALQRPMKLRHAHLFQGSWYYKGIKYENRQDYNLVLFADLTFEFTCHH